MVDHLLREKRLLLAGRHMKRGTGLPQAYYQTVECLTFSCGKVECPGLSSNKNYYYIDLPELASFRDAVAYLGPISDEAPFYQVSISGLQSHTRRFGLTRPRYTVINSRAVFKEDPGITRVRLRAVLWDPTQGLCGGNKNEFEYPIATHDVHELTVMVLKQLLSTLPVPADTTNDATNQGPQGDPQLRDL